MVREINIITFIFLSIFALFIEINMVNNSILKRIARIDLLLLVGLTVALYSQTINEVIITGIWIGFLREIFSIENIPLMLIIYFLCIILIFYIKEALYKEHLLTVMCIVWISSVLMRIADILIEKGILLKELKEIIYFIFFSAFLTTLISPLIFILKKLIFNKEE